MQVEALHISLRAHSSLRVTLLLDYLRGTRNTAKPKHAVQSSVTLLLPLLREFPDRVKSGLAIYRHIVSVSLNARDRCSATGSTPPHCTAC